VKAIVRHLVKSFTGEHVQEANVMPYSLYGDHSHAYIDNSRTNKFLTITQAPIMASYQASFMGPDSLDTSTHRSSHAIRKRVTWNHPGLIKDLETAANRSITPVQFTLNDVPLGAIEVEHLKLVTDASLLELKKQHGSLIDYQRFRPNLIVDLTEKQPYIEDTWLGRRLLVGESVEIQVNRHCERCMIITINPEDSEKNPSLLKFINRTLQNCFGVYASLLNTGKIRIGDEV
jgi:uncharacterized protein YcbX